MPDDLTLEQRVVALEQEVDRLANLIEDLKESDPTTPLWNARERDREQHDNEIEKLERKVRDLEDEHDRKLNELHRQLCAVQNLRAYPTW